MVGLLQYMLEKTTFNTAANQGGEGQESTSNDFAVFITRIWGGVDPKPSLVTNDEPAIVPGLWGTFQMQIDGQYEYTLYDDTDPSRTVTDSFRYELSDGSEFAEDWVRFRIDPSDSRWRERSYQAVFGLVLAQIAENQKRLAELKAQVAKSTGLEPGEIRRVEDWGDRFMAVLPQGNRFVGKTGD